MKITDYLFTIALASAMMAGVSSCTNPEVEILQGVEIELHPETILNSFTAYSSDNFQMYSDSDGDSKLRITCLIYDESGDLAFQKEALLNNFNEDATYFAPLPDGKYDLVAIASCIQGSLSSPIYEPYEITGKESLDRLKITQNNQSCFYSSISFLGYVAEPISTSKTKNSFDMKPGTALVYLQWKDVHSHDGDGSSAIDEYAIIYHNNDIMQFSNGRAPKCSTSLSSVNNNLSLISPSKNPDATNIYEMINLFPGNTALFGRTFIGNDKKDYSNQTMSFVAGHQYVISFDCSALNMSAYEGVFGVKAALAAGSTFDKMGKIAEK